MSPPPALRLRGVGKRYLRHAESPSIVGGARRLLRRTSRSELWAVRDLDLDVDDGECVGLIGRNGSGKSTLLQMLCGVTAPTTGEVRVRGRVAPLISVGVGFHPELSGRENISVNAAILGLSRAEVARKVDAIVDFSGVEAFLDTPIKFYSSGMTVRLGFSVAVHADPEVLLVDEVLAVGDLAFQVKSYDRMQQLRDTGTTLVVVSHDLHAVQRLCPRTLVVDAGRGVFDGETAQAVSVYHELLAAGADADGALRREQGVVVVDDVHLRDASGARTARLTAGEPVVVVVEAGAREQVDSPCLVVQVRSADGVVVYSDSNVLDPFAGVDAGQRVRWEVELTARLPSGTYAVTVHVVRAAPGTGLGLDELLEDVAVLASPSPLLCYVAGRPMVHGVADLEGRFRVAAPSGAATGVSGAAARGDVLAGAPVAGTPPSGGPAAAGG